MTARQRADVLLVARGLFDSRTKAQAAIAAGRVTADGAMVRKASEEIAVDAQIAAEPAHPWVSRGGIKLAYALDRLALDVTGRIALDVGASTGGFTEVLLARGARRIFAVDVGRDQLHASLRGRPEIVSLEETDIRALDPAALDVLPAVMTADVSFISLKQVLPSALALAAPRAYLVALIKPQFEVGARRQLKKGIVRDPTIHAAVCADMAACIAALGWQVDATFASPIAGGDGNREFFIGAHRG
jgi:23S rRNA (cytidine1920-2'-O)/16S rRNA (cytidine1409-2'-O)-methyltransferase